MQIQISWLLQKPTDLDLQCLQMQGISRFSRTRVNIKPCLSGFNVNSKIILQKSQSSSFSDFLIFGPTLSDLFWFLVLPHQIFFQVLVLPYLFWCLVLPYQIFSNFWSYNIRSSLIFWSYNIRSFLIFGLSHRCPIFDAQPPKWRLQFVHLPPINANFKSPVTDTA